MDDKPAQQVQTFSVRPSKELLPRIKRLAAENGRSEAQIFLESAASIADMVDLGYDFVPPLVQRSRIIREHLGGTNDRSLLGGGGIHIAPSDFQIAPSESVRGLSPNLRFLPLYSQFPAFSDSKKRKQHQTIEQIGIPARKAVSARFAIDPTRASKTLFFDRMLGFDWPPGTILLFAKPEDVFDDVRRAAKLEKQSAPDYKSARDYMIYEAEYVAGWHNGAPFIGSINTSESDENGAVSFVEVVGGLYNSDEYEFRLEDCTDVCMVVGSLSVPTPTKLDIQAADDEANF